MKSSRYQFHPHLKSHFAKTSLFRLARSGLFVFHKKIGGSVDKIQFRQTPQRESPALLLVLAIVAQFVSRVGTGEVTGNLATSSSRELVYDRCIGRIG